MLDTIKALAADIWHVSELIDRICFVAWLVFAGFSFANNDIQWGFTNLVFVAWLITVLIWQSIAMKWKRRYEEAIANVSASWQPAQTININVRDTEEGLRKAQQIADLRSIQHHSRG
ncbi:hypothetical protein [Nocardia niwae]|uniref:hypothetical protein n=1 Tax=Nocardia niwae TaxID=626084 RepID=UPI0007A3871D|nr:hypothetical protein [Nocardia niwae]